MSTVVCQRSHGWLET